MSKVLSFWLLLFLAIAAGILIVYWSISRPFCTNSLSCKESFTLKVENGATGVFAGQKISVPTINLALESSNKTLGETTTIGTKHIYIDLTNQTLEAYEGTTLFMKAFVSTGKWHPTPDGDFSIWEKVRATRMTGGTGADYYDLPNVPYVMFFQGPGAPAGSGFGIHGAYWHDNFGHAMSHGCVNMRPIDAEKLYFWADNGTQITINGQTP